MKILNILLITLFIYQINSRPLAPNRVIWAINCGSDLSRRSHRSFIYEKDQNFDTSIETMTLDYSKRDEYKDQMIYYSNDVQVHMTQRYSHDKIRYNIPMKDKQEGKYVIILGFVEMEFGKKNKRQFDVKLGDQVVLQNLDIASKYGGKFYAHNEYIEIKYRDNHILWDKPKSLDKYVIDLNADGSLTLELAKKKDYPIINSIILYQGGIVDTNMHEVEMEQEQWVNKNKEKLREEFKKKKEEKKQQEIKEQQEFELKQNKHRHKDQDGQQELPPLKDLLFNPLGIVMMIGFFVSTFVMIYFTFFDPYGIEKEEREKQSLPIKNKKVAQQYEQLNTSADSQLTKRMK